jgi:hypothetical protein
MNEINTNVEVYCTVLFEGIHCWPECPFEEVKYLRDPHRHVFHIKVFKRVNHDDRDVEFIMLKHRVEEYLHEKYPDGQLGATSCEMLGRELLGMFNATSVQVSEDGENGAFVMRTPNV